MCQPLAETCDVGIEFDVTAWLHCR